MPWTTKSSRAMTHSPVPLRQIYIAPAGSTSGQSGYLSPAASSGQQQAGWDLCGMCRVCTCLHAGFLRTPTAAVKIIEFLIGLTCQFLLLKYGMKYGSDLGAGYSVYLTCCSACLLTSTVLLFCYIVSPNTYNRVRPSLFEVVFNAVACGLYLAASTFLATAVHFHLYYFYKTIAGFSAYPAMTGVYVMGYIVGIVHGIDSAMALKFMRATR
eukprot:TRINITY_DN9733_c0_g1_i3.p1 TRINITY_DN9733_c0_g1~~TRINITY_DN9733_c0_g1_i3.p1  ORF type:complete len:234 (-),score=26.70 TRINITY_DN9733_c0_g1_i3:379-1014(-)